MKQMSDAASWQTQNSVPSSRLDQQTVEEQHENFSMRISKPNLAKGCQKSEAMELDHARDV